MSVAVQNTSGIASASTFDAASITRTLCYESSGTAGSVLDDMARLREFDREQERQSRKWMTVGLIGLGVLVIGVICFFAEASILGTIFGAVGLVTAAVGFFIRSTHARLNLEDKRYEIAAKVLGLLSKDMAPDASVSLSLDFRAHNHKTKFVRNGKVSYWDVKYYANRWLEMSGRFLDGTKYSVTMIEKHQDRSRKKRSASGKTKYKSKTKSASEAIVSVRVKEKRYPGGDPKSYDLQKAVQLPDWVQLKSIQREGESLTIRATTSASWSAGGPGDGKVQRDGAHWLALMFLNLYQHLNQSKS